MYYTLTFNPAIDYIIELKDFCEGDLNRTTNEKFLPGGKGINVSTVLSNFGVETVALGFVAGFTGIELERMLEKNNVKTDFIYLDNGTTRINVKIKSSLETEINANGPIIKEQDFQKLYTKLDKLQKDDFLILSGSVPKSIQSTAYCDIAEYISDKKVNIVIDAEKELLLNVLKYRPFLIKPNKNELEAMLGEKLNTVEEIRIGAYKLQQMGARNVFISMAGMGGVFLAENGESLYCSAPQGTVINSTGAGDSALAAFLASYKTEKNYERAFKMGICAGSAAAFSEELATKLNTESLFKKLGACIPL